MPGTIIDSCRRGHPEKIRSKSNQQGGLATGPSTGQLPFESQFDCGHATKLPKCQLSNIWMKTNNCNCVTELNHRSSNSNQPSQFIEFKMNSRKPHPGHVMHQARTNSAAQLAHHSVLQGHATHHLQIETHSCSHRWSHSPCFSMILDDFRRFHDISRHKSGTADSKQPAPNVWTESCIAVKASSKVPDPVTQALQQIPHLYTSCILWVQNLKQCSTLRFEVSEVT